MPEYTAIISLLGEENVTRLKNEITDIIIANVRSDFEERSEYMYSPYVIENLMNEVIEEVKDEVKEIVKERMLEDMMSKLEGMI